MHMTFEQTFKLKELSSLPPPKLIADHGIAAGSFEKGLVFVVDRDLGETILSAWRWLLGPDATLLVATALGDLFFWSDKYGAIYFLEVQYGKSTFVDKDVGFFLNEFVTKKEILDRVFHRELFSTLTARLGSPQYGECYIALPWLRHGGTGEVGTYAKGELAAYVSLVGQAVQRAMAPRSQ